MKPVLELQDIVITVPTRSGRAPVVDGLCLTLEPGQTLGIVGESGCGKSLLSLAVMGLLPPGVELHSGDIRLSGRSLNRLRESDMRHVRGNEIGMIFQEPMTALNPVFKVGEQIAEVFRIHRGLGHSQAWKGAVEMLEAVGVSEPARRAKSYPAQLSGGMRQRAMIAMALACRPKVLIADEPTTALDPTVQAQILQLIRELQKDYGTAVIFISHDLGVISQVADETAVLYAGQVVERGPTRGMFQAPLHPYTRGLLRALPDPDASEITEILFEIKGSVPSPDEFPSGCRFSPRCELARDVCRNQAPTQLVRDNNHVVSCWEYQHG